MENFEEQHAIPQQISAYEFHLVGDMTLKQFFQLAAGALVSLVLYATTLPAIIKWPLIVVSFLIGVAMAFFPLEGRPLEKWLFLFAKSIYSPTLFVWDRSKAVKSYFKPEDAGTAAPISLPKRQDEEIEQQAQLAPVGQIEETKSSLKNLESQEAQFLENVSQMQNTFPSQSSSDQSQLKVAKPTSRGDIQIPKTPQLEVEAEEKEEKKKETSTVEPEIKNEITPTEIQDSSPAQQAEFSPEAAPPSPPTTPNIIVGQVLEDDGKIIEAAILEIKDDLGRPTRAVKTNKLGHFQIVTPLVDGNYKIITEKDGFSFDTVEIQVKGEIIPPILIKGHKAEGQVLEVNKTDTDTTE